MDHSTRYPLPSIPGHILAAVLSLFTVFGKADLSSNRQLLMGLIGVYLLYLLIWWLLQISFFRYHLIDDTPAPWSERRVFLFAAVICLLGWLPYFLTYYPGLLSSDSVDQLSQVMGTQPYSNHHPWLHTLFIGLIYRIGSHIFGSPNSAIALYTIVQMLIMAAVYAYTIMILYRHQVRRWLLLAALAFYAFIPFQGIYSITMWKDILFCGICLLFGVLLWQLTTEKITWCKLAAYCILGILMCLFRSNGFYAYMLCLPFFLWGFRKKGKGLLIASVLTLIAVFSFKGPILSAFQVSEPDLAESLSIPLQQVAATIHSHTTACLTDEEHTIFGTVMDLNRVGDSYFRHISDPIKNLVRQNLPDNGLTEYLGDFLKCYIQLGLRYPKEYLLAFIHQTYGYWSPTVSYWVISPEIYPNDFGIHFQPLLSDRLSQPLIEHTFQWEENAGLLWRIATYVWTMLSCVAVAAHKKNWRYLLVFLPFLALWASLLIATPVYAEFRYAYSIIAAWPLFLALAGRKEGEAV